MKRVRPLADTPNRFNPNVRSDERKSASLEPLMALSIPPLTDLFKASQPLVEMAGVKELAIFGAVSALIRIGLTCFSGNLIPGGILLIIALLTKPPLNAVRVLALGTAVAQLVLAFACLHYSRSSLDILDYQPHWPRMVATLASLAGLSLSVVETRLSPHVRNLLLGIGYMGYLLVSIDYLLGR